jgi:hypothetical protein
MNRCVVGAFFAFFILAGLCLGATLEKLTVEEMAQKSTLIVRGRVIGCSGEMQGAVIYTACTVSVTERWKGSSGSEVRFVIPGGRARGLIQTFTGTPKLENRAEYVLFLWAGRSGVNQVIGMSQGVFSLGGDTASRKATSERMVNKAGVEVEDEALTVGVTELRERVRQALAAEAQ